MLSFIYNFLTDRKPNSATTAVPMPWVSSNPSSGISFDSNLVNELKGDHTRLVQLFGKMWDEGFAKGNYKLVSKTIDEFKYEFQTHILKENVKFYAYLEQNVTDDPHTLRVIREFRRDMNDIANAVIQFCKRYQATFFTEDMKHDFREEYAAIGEALTKRVTLEERDLYSLYSRRR